VREEGEEVSERPMQELDDEVAAGSEVEVADEIVFDEKAEDLPDIEAPSVVGRDAREKTKDEKPVLDSRHRRHSRRASKRRQEKSEGKPTGRGKLNQHQVSPQSKEELCVGPP
jgi:hypothetical protein